MLISNPGVILDDADQRAGAARPARGDVGDVDAGPGQDVPHHVRLLPGGPGAPAEQHRSEGLRASRPDRRGRREEKLPV